MSKTAFPDLIETLGETGFTQLQAAAYIALLKMGEETGSAVAKDSGINRSKIYDILEQLEEMNVVRKISRDNKVLYEAVPPHDVFPEKKRKYEQMIDDAIDQLTSISKFTEEIEPDKITLTKLLLKDIDLKKYEYLISSNEGARIKFVDLLDKESRPDASVKILNLNNHEISRGIILVTNEDEMLVFGTPIGKSVEALRIQSHDLTQFFKGVIENAWVEDLPEMVRKQIETGAETALYIGKSLSMTYRVEAQEKNKYERPVTFLINDSTIGFYAEYSDTPDPRIPVRNFSNVSVEIDGSLVLSGALYNGKLHELRIRTVENPIFLKNLISFIAKQPKQ